MSLIEGCSNTLVPAVAYARMSTDLQNYSIQHQLASIDAFAATHGLAILRAYVDEGRSGLSLRNRSGLQSLLAAATNPSRDFSVIVVYDVSRWGRFQDVDESAFYEYACRKAGVTIVYCAEQFVDDGSPFAAIMKSIKRAMAAEYSRELSAKVFLAQCRFSKMGYKQGGLPGYGLRRVPISVDGNARMPLGPGERKPMPTDRVALMLGSSEEVDTVRRIYYWYTEEGLSDSEISRRLDSEGVDTHMGDHWRPSNVRRILMNERYCGQMLYNQTTRRMRSKAARNPENTWIRCDGALQAIVSRECFTKAQSIRDARASGPDPVAILDRLRTIHSLHGTINMELCKDPLLPSRQIMVRLFGGYVQAYAAAGLPPLYTEKGALGIRSMRILVEKMMSEVCEKVIQADGCVAQTAIWNILLLNNRLKLKVSIASCRNYEDSWQRWRIALRSGASADFVLCALMNTDNSSIRCYLLLPTAQAEKNSIFLSERKLQRYAASCFMNLNEVFGLEGRHDM